MATEPFRERAGWWPWWQVVISGAEFDSLRDGLRGRPPARLKRPVPKSRALGRPDSPVTFAARGGAGEGFWGRVQGMKTVFRSCE